ncbi:hypothetical protein [Streptomyces sp. TLI_171]|uniref:hypothetical protein n=1 Tax=Streptomyces sp. TLI_171 TaxID=1938859 RepID=UPI000C18C45C|nr:hypothetical protein [Streptomyces sp. TLI_171]RKE18250.1 hypothetical protein BX266_1534 [Streptomyces sp. TLI_171]
MIAFQFTRRPGQGEPTGFDLGDIAVSGPHHSFSSAGLTPDQGMMIFPSLTLLLDQVRELLAARRGTVAFHGVDSSFRLDFATVKAGVAVSARKQSLGAVSVAELLDALNRAAADFARTELPLLPADDPFRDDLTHSLAAFAALQP